MHRDSNDFFLVTRIVVMSLFTFIAFGWRCYPKWLKFIYTAEQWRVKGQVVAWQCWDLNYWPSNPGQWEIGEKLDIFHLLRYSDLWPEPMWSMTTTMVSPVVLCAQELSCLNPGSTVATDSGHNDVWWECHHGNHQSVKYVSDAVTLFEHQMSQSTQPSYSPFQKYRTTRPVLFF